MKRLKKCLVAAVGIVGFGFLSWAPAQEVFYRGDCNGSGLPDGMAVDVADAMATISALFDETGKAFVPPCLDACDANDDGSVNMADPMFLIEYLFKGGEFPPAPGPGFSVNDRVLSFTEPGEDPTEDDLDCGVGVMDRL